MNRRTALAALALSLGLLPASASADLAPSPPPPVRIIGRSSLVTVSGGVDHARYTLRNESDQPLEVFLVQVVEYQSNGTRVPSEIERVTRAEGGEALRRTMTIPARGSVDVIVFFRELSPRADGWNVALRATVNGARVEGVAEIHRGHRDPARKRVH
ncbi:MAG: hypothetical protein AB7S26_17200 [Sandaracinaceae bacterium]